MVVKPETNYYFYFALITRPRLTRKFRPECFLSVRLFVSAVYLAIALSEGGGFVL